MIIFSDKSVDYHELSPGTYFAVRAKTADVARECFSNSEQSKKITAFRTFQIRMPVSAAAFLQYGAQGIPRRDGRPFQIYFHPLLRHLN